VICMDAKTPASLSPAVHQILRKQLNFEGVILTDDLEMVAAVNYGAEQSESLAVLALQAGNDMLVVTDLPEQFAAIEAAVNNGRVSEQAINQAVLRILCWKLQLGLCE
ncbi:MAG: glycoside hydrolase family 3 N-terminal domain-containing protein, partial [Clostridiales bacterium]